MSQRKGQKNKRASRLRAMVPLEVLAKEYMTHQTILSQCRKNLKNEMNEFLNNEPISSIPESNASFDNDIANVSSAKLTVKRGRLRRKDIALNPDLYKNKKSCTDTPKYKCEICEKFFMTVAKLESHHQCHLPKEEKEALKKYHCEYCPRTFKELNKLNSHRNFKHFKDYKYICEVCGKPFINSSELKRHATLSHTERLACTICGKQVLNLEMHYKDVHENSPKTCGICLEILPNQKKLNKHRYQKHPFQIYECEICDRTFTEKFCYKRHMSDKHGVVIQEDLIF